MKIPTCNYPQLWKNDVEKIGT